jgi:hypothetical protein
MVLLKSYSGASEFTTIFLYQISAKGVFESTRYNPGHQKPGRYMEKLSTPTGTYKHKWITYEYRFNYSNTACLYP